MREKDWDDWRIVHLRPVTKGYCERKNHDLVIMGVKVCVLGEVGDIEQSISQLPPSHTNIHTNSLYPSFPIILCHGSLACHHGNRPKLFFLTRDWLGLTRSWGVRSCAQNILLGFKKLSMQTAKYTWLDRYNSTVIDNQKQHIISWRLYLRAKLFEDLRKCVFHFND